MASPARSPRPRLLVVSLTRWRPFFIGPTRQVVVRDRACSPVGPVKCTEVSTGTDQQGASRHGTSRVSSTVGLRTQ
jgi:hypothetical protein